MGLSSDLISQFVKVTNDVETDKPSNTVYGTVVEYEGEKYVRIDGSERLTRAGKVADAEVNDRVVVTIENHTATITGNISSPSARTDRVEELGGEIQKVGILVAGKVSTDELIAQIARIDSLVAEDVVIEKRLDAAEAVIVTLDATYATIDKLESEYATIEKLESEYTTTTNLEAKYATISKLESDYATIAKLESDYIKTTEIDAKYATIAKLENEYASIAHLTANYATAIELQVVEGTIGSLNSDVADIKTLTSNFISGNTVHTNFANAVIAQLGDAQIKSAMIKDISAAKITSGDIITDNVNVKSQDGRLLIADQTIQISDTTRVRVQIGKDASGDYSINVWDANGKLMFSEGGLTEDAVKEQIIRNDMVKDDANISASKLDIDTLFEVINEDGSHTLKSSKVKLDEEGQTLDVAFKSMTTKIDGLGDDITTQGTNISVIQGQISSKIWQQDINTTFEDAMGNLKIGGRNLLLDTGSAHDLPIKIRTSPDYGSASISSINNQNGVFTLQCSATEHELYYRFMQPAGDTTWGLAPGETYILSGKVKITTESGSFAKLTVRTQANVGSGWSFGVNVTVATEDTADWLYFSVPFVIEEDAIGYYVSFQLYPVDYLNSSPVFTELKPWLGTLEFMELKLEQGTKATDWTPAPEDTQTSITTLNTQYSFVNQAIGNFSSVIGSFESTGDGDTLSSRTSSLKQTVDSLSSIIGSFENTGDGDTLCSRTSALEQNLEGFKSTVSEVYTTKAAFSALQYDNINLLKNTKNPVDNSYWTRGNTVTDSDLNENVFYITTSSTSESTAGTHRIKVIGGATYTVSVLVKRTANVRSIDFFFLSRKETDTNDFVYIQNKTNMIPEAGVWTRYVWTFTMHAEAEEGYLRIDHNGSSDGANATLCYTNIKMEKGDKATDWSASPEEFVYRMGSAKTSINQNANQISLTASKLNEELGLVRSEIQQLADSINLSVTSTLGQTATIKLTANGQTEAKEIDFNVREAFANDPTAIDISAGTVTFNAGTLLINSTNFTLDETGYIVANSGSIGGIELTGYGLYGGTYGSYFGLYKYYDLPGELDQVCFFAGALDTVPNNPKFYVTHSGRMYAEDATIKGSITTTDGILTTELNAGSLSYYYNDDLRLTLERKGLGLYYNGSVCGYVTSELIEDVYPTTSLILRTPIGGCIQFARETEAGGAIIMYGMRDTTNIQFNALENGTYDHVFMGHAYFLGNIGCSGQLTMKGMAYFRNQCAIGWYDASGKGPYQFISVGSDNIFSLGSDSYNTTIEGSIINLSAKSRVHMINGVEEIIFDGLESIGTYSGYFYPKTSGYCCLGVSANRWYRLYAANDCSISSDIRLKENIVPLGSNSTTRSTLDEEVPIDIHSELFDRLIPVQYNMIDGDDRIRYGFVAQQVSSAMAELGINEDELDLVQHDHWVDEQTGESREEYGMVYNNLIAMLVHEVQKLKREIKTLKGE